MSEEDNETTVKSGAKGQLGEKQRIWKNMMLRALGMEVTEDSKSNLPWNTPDPALAKLLDKDPSVRLAVISMKPPAEKLGRVIAHCDSKEHIEAPILQLHGSDPEYIETLCLTSLEKAGGEVKSDIQKGAVSAGTFLRGSSVTVSLLKKYSLSGGGKEYVASVTKGAISSAGANTIKLGKDEDPARNPEMIKRVSISVEGVIRALLQADPPRPIATTSSIIADTTLESGVNSNLAMALVGGHIFIRLISPTLALSGAKDGGAEEISLTSKILQLLANGAKPKGKLEMFAPLGQYVEVLRERFTQICNQGRVLRGLDEFDYRKNEFLAGDEDENEPEFVDPLGSEGTEAGDDNDWLGVFKGPNPIMSESNFLGGASSDSNELDIDPMSTGTSRRSPRPDNLFTGANRILGEQDFLGGEQPEELNEMDTEPLISNSNQGGKKSTIFGDNAPVDEITDVLNLNIEGTNTNERFVPLEEEEVPRGRNRGDTRANQSTNKPNNPRKDAN